MSGRGDIPDAALNSNSPFAYFVYFVVILRCFAEVFAVHIRVIRDRVPRSGFNLRASILRGLGSQIRG
jgi:hypothetical protein